MLSRQMVGDLLWQLAVIAGPPLIVVGCHETTHYLAARLTGPAQFHVATWIPPRFRLAFDTDSALVQRLVFVAPTLVGLLLAALALVSGAWTWIRTAEPYYLEVVAGLSWLLYTLPSPADLRAAIWLDDAENKPLYWLRAKLGLE